MHAASTLRCANAAASLFATQGCRDVYESFDKYCEVEELVGENKYRTDSDGLQDAIKGLKFEVLPPVLQLHLRRFDYDYQRDTMLKVCAGKTPHQLC